MSDRPRPGGFAAAPPKAGEGARPGAADEESTDKVDALPDASVEESPTIDSPHPIQQVPTAFVMPAVRVPARPVIIGPPPSSQPPLPSTPPPSWPQPPPTDDELTAPTELPRGRLRVDEGEQKGRTFYLNQDETRIGRANENDVVLLDIGVSRRHLRIDRHDAGFRLYDLDSGNGTYVNGRRIIEAELFDDDTIEAGSTVMVFGTVGKPRLRSEAGETDPGAAVPAHRRGLPVSWLILMALVTFVSVLSTMYLVRTLRAPTARPIAEPATSFLDRARTAIEARQWGEARGHLDVARALGEAPEAAEALRAQVEREARNAEQLAEARRRLAEGAPVSELRALLARIDVESVYTDDARKLLSEARQVQLNQQLDEAEAAMKRGLRESARLTIEAVLREDSGNERARALRDAIRQAESQ